VMLNEMDIDRRAAWLESEHVDRKPFQAFAGADALADLDEAYAVQHAYVARLARRHGTRIAGYKVGLTSARMQAMCGIESPIAGVVLADRLHQSGARIRRADYGRLGIECEIGVRLGRDLPTQHAPFDFAAVAAAVDAVCPAIEIVDDRGADYRTLEMRSLVADNSWNAGVVLGAFRTAWPDLDGVIGTLALNGIEVDRGRGADVLGHPFASLRWLANHLALHGTGLRAGDIVATGSLVTTRFPTMPESYRFEVGGLGFVALDIVD
jgi:2-keto-4-pentenoate hydratase